MIDELLNLIRGYWLTLVAKVDTLLDNSFPTSQKKNLFIAFVALVEVFAVYVVAVLDLGMWIGDCSPAGMVAAYLLSDEKSFPWLFYLVVFCLVLYGTYYFLRVTHGGNTGRGFSISDSNVYGSAKEITDEELREIADIVPVEAATGTILGQLDLTERQLITTKDIPNFNKNALYLAPPGSGKTHCIGIPAIIQAIIRGESVVTTDTKGELWAKTVELARLHGYLIRRIDFKTPAFSDGWDVLGEVRGDDFRAKIASEIYMANSNTDGEHDIHATAASNLLAALMLFVSLTPTIGPEQKNLYNVYTILNQGPEAMDALFSIAQDDPEMRVAWDYYSSFRGSEKLRENIISSLAKRLNIVTSTNLRVMTSTPDVDLTLPGQRKCIYYVELPDQHHLVRPLASLFFSFLFMDLADYADSLRTQRLKVPVNVMIEEAYACGKINNLDTGLSTLRSRGVGITIIAQSVAQINELYGENMKETILECCSTFGCLGANSKATSELFEWMAGEATVEVQTDRHNYGEGPVKLGRGYTSGVGRQRLYTSNDVRKIKFRRILLVWQRYDPKLAYTFGYKKHPEYRKKHMPKISGLTTIPITDREARAFFRAKEEERIMQYEEWIAGGGNPWEGYTFKRKRIRGQYSGKPNPYKWISYPKLEKLALAHSAQAAPEPAAALMKELQQVTSDTMVLPADMEWHHQEIYEGDPNTLDDIENEDLDVDGDFTDLKAPPEPEHLPAAGATSAASTAQPPQPAPVPPPSDPVILDKQKPPRRPPQPELEFTSDIMANFGCPGSEENIMPFEQSTKKPRDDPFKKESQKLSI